MRLALAALLVLPACVIDLGNDPPPPCQYGALIPAPLVNPVTLECQQFSNGCDNACGPCPLAADLVPYPTWGSCASECRSLGETACAGTTGCRGAYDDYCLNADGPCPLLTPFLGCYPTDTTGPVQGACANLDAFECSRHDDCLATYRSDAAGNRTFATCMTEFVFECPPNADCAP